MVCISFQKFVDDPKNQGGHINQLTQGGESLHLDNRGSSILIPCEQIYQRTDTFFLFFRKTTQFYVAPVYLPLCYLCRACIPMEKFFLKFFKVNPLMM